MATALLLSPAFAAEGEMPAEPSPHVVVVGTYHPGPIPYTRGMTVMDAILSTGGYSEFGHTPLYLIRNSKSTKLDLREIVRTPKKDLPLKPWDIIYFQ